MRARPAPKPVPPTPRPAWWRRRIVVGGLAAAAALLLAGLIVVTLPRLAAHGGIREAPAATRLANGQVLLSGGELQYSRFVHDSAIRYDRATDTWSSAGRMTRPRSKHAMTLLKDGRVLVTGGQNDDQQYLNAVERYDPSTNTWAEVARLNVARRDHLATLLSDGHVLVLGGTTASPPTSTEAERYNPAADVWVSAGRLDYSHPGSATVLEDGQVLVISGGLFSNYVFRYDPVANRWAPAAKPAVARSGHTATRLADGRVLVAGGGLGGETPEAREQTGRSVELYDAATDTWKRAAPMRWARSSHAAVLLPNGHVLVIAGNFQASFAEEYDPTADTWTPIEADVRQRSSFTATLLADGQVLVAGGDTFGRDWLETRRYYPPAARWWPAAPLPGDVWRGLSVVLDRGFRD